MDKMTIGKRFLITSGTCMILLTILAVVANFGLISSGKSVNLLVANTLPTAVVTGDLSNDLLKVRGDYWSHMATNTPDGMDRVEADIRRDRSQTAKDYQTYTLSMDDNDENRGNYAALGSAIREYDAAWEQVRPVSRTGDTNAAVVVYNRLCEPKLQQIEVIMARMVDYNKRVGAKISEDSLTASTRSTWLTRLIALLAVGVGILLSWYMTTSTNGVLRDAALALSEGSEQVVTAASQVSSASQTLAQGASEQAASLEETSAAANEINSMAQRNTRNSQNTAEMVSKSQQSFSETNKLLDELLNAMGGIEDSSKKISKIIKAIEEIAFQTNILALNAAVEAARAGESGMGFAVVAEEVRNLAQRSARAATDTASLIEESIQKSTGGRVNVDRVVTAIRGLTEESTKMRVLVDEIYLGSSEQAKGLDQIGRSIMQIEQVTQGTAASSEESAAAAEELTAQAQSMQESVGRLRELVDGGGAGYSSRPGSARRNSEMVRLGVSQFGRG